MAKKQGHVIQFAEFREPHGVDHENGLSDEEGDANSGLKTFIRTARHGGYTGRWTFTGWTTPRPFW
jgi:hypothetical protein